MREPSVHVNIHANHPDVQFQPIVTQFDSSGKEVIAVHLETVRVFLNRERLHQLKDVLVAACETYPILPVPPLTVTYGEEGRPAPYPCPHCGGTLAHLHTCSVVKDQESRRAEA